MTEESEKNQDVRNVARTFMYSAALRWFLLFGGIFFLFTSGLFLSLPWLEPNDPTSLGFRLFSVVFCCVLAVLSFRAAHGFRERIEVDEDAITCICRAHLVARGTEARGDT